MAYLEKLVLRKSSPPVTSSRIAPGSSRSYLTSSTWVSWGRMQRKGLDFPGKPVTCEEERILLSNVILTFPAGKIYGVRTYSTITLGRKSSVFFSVRKRSSRFCDGSVWGVEGAGSFFFQYGNCSVRYSHYAGVMRQLSFVFRPRREDLHSRKMVSVSSL